MSCPRGQMAQSRERFSVKAQSTRGPPPDARAPVTEGWSHGRDLLLCWPPRLLGLGLERAPSLGKFFKVFRLWFLKPHATEVVLGFASLGRHHDRICLWTGRSA